MTVDQATTLLHLLLMNGDGASSETLKLRIKLERFLSSQVPHVKPTGMESGAKLADEPELPPS